MLFTGPRAAVQFMDGQTHSMPAEPFRRLSLHEGDRFIMVVQYAGRQVVDVKVERPSEARPAQEPRATPKVYVKDGLKYVTRR